MKIIDLKTFYLAIGIAGASALINGVAVQAQTTKSSAEDVVKIKSNLEEMSLSKDYDFMLQLSENQTPKTKTNTPAVIAQTDSNTLPSQTTPTTPNTLPSDNLQPTTPSTLPSQTTPTTPSDNLQPTTPDTLPSQTTPDTLPSQTTPNTLPSDNTQPTTPDTYPSQTTPTTPNTLPSDNTQPTIPSDGSDPSIRDNTQPTIPSDGSTPSDDSTPSSGVSPGTATRSGSSYIGVGGNIGFGGSTGIGEGSFSVLSKIGLTDTISVRPAALFGDQTSILLPVTLDFPATDVAELGTFRLAPYVGAGAVISTGDNSTVGFLLTGGVDVPLTSQFTATAGLNVGFIDGTDVGLLLGVGYNFSGL